MDNGAGDGSSTAWTTVRRASSSAAPGTQGGGMKGIFMTRFRRIPVVVLAERNAGGRQLVRRRRRRLRLIRLGSLDTYYQYGTDEFGARAVALLGISILSWWRRCRDIGGNTNASIANASRSANVVRRPARHGRVGRRTYRTTSGDDGAVGVRRRAHGRSTSRGVAGDHGQRAYWDADYEGLPTNDGQQCGACTAALRHLHGRPDLGRVEIKGATDAKRGAWSITLTAKLGPGTLLFGTRLLGT